MGHNRAGDDAKLKKRRAKKEAKKEAARLLLLHTQNGPPPDRFAIEYGDREPFNPKELDLYRVNFKPNPGLKHKPLAFDKLKEYLEQRARQGIQEHGFQPEGDLVGYGDHDQLYCIVPEKDKAAIRQVLYEFGYKYLNREYTGTLE